MRTGFYLWITECGIDGYVPDPNRSYELKGGGRAARGIGKSQYWRDAEHRRRRKKLRRPAGGNPYQKRISIVEPVFRILKQQRGLRQFRLRGSDKVRIEFTSATIAYNLTRVFLSNGWHEDRAPCNFSEPSFLSSKGTFSRTHFGAGC